MFKHVDGRSARSNTTEPVIPAPWNCLKNCPTNGDALPRDVVGGALPRDVSSSKSCLPCLSSPFTTNHGLVSENLFHNVRLEKRSQGVHEGSL